VAQIAGEQATPRAADARKGSDSRTRVLIEITNPHPVGLFALGLGALLLGVFKLGWVASGEQKTVGLLFLAFALPLQSMGALLSFFSGRSISATIFSVLAVIWLSLGLVLLTSPPGHGSDTLAIFLFWLGGLIFAIALVALFRMLLMSALLVLGAPVLVLAGVSEYHGTHRGVDHVAGAFALALSVVATYGGLAFMLEDVAKREILPLFRAPWRR
jgi:succinate-acetate transporter protein